jgi:cation-transporting ATPase I
VHTGSSHSPGEPRLASSAAAAACQVVHSSFGRLRLHFPRWPVRRVDDLTAHLSGVGGVRRVEANLVTRNVLLVYEPRQISAQALLGALPKLVEAANTVPPVTPARQSTAAPADSPDLRQEIVPLPGLDRDPALGARAVERLQRVLGVRAWVSLLTGQVHVIYDQTRVRFDDVVGVVGRLRHAEVPGEDHPRHPLDPNPLRDGVTRVVGALAGVGFLTLQRLIAPQLVPAGVASAAGGVAGAFMLIQGYPAARDGLRRLLGRRAADLFTTGSAISALTLGNVPLGLVAAGLEGFFLTEEVTARRAAYRRYEDSIDTGLSALPGAVIRLEAGTRVPRDARVIEGFGSALGPEGQQQGVKPGGRLTAGTLLLGGPFVLELQSGEPVVHQPRPGPRAPTPYESYQRVAGPVALAVAAVQVLRTGSLLRGLEALLLLNPRPAVMGTEAAHLTAAGRALRAGLTVVGTRSDRPIASLPDTLLLDGARLLTDGLEVGDVLPLQMGMNPERILKLAAALSEAAGAPWGTVFATTETPTGADGSFDGRTATARIGGTCYHLRQLSSAAELHPSLAGALNEELLLELRAGSGEGPLGLIALRPRLSQGLDPLIQACRRYGVELAVLAGGEPGVARLLCRRAAVPLLDADVSTAIRNCQGRGKTVAVVSDGAQAEAAFAVCDLAIGISRGHSGLFPARADILAPDLRAVADLLEVGSRQRKADRDALLLAGLSQAIGVGLLFRGPIGFGNASTAVYLTGLAALGASWFRQRGGDRPESALTYLTDPAPERWGRRTIAEVLRTFGTAEEGLSAADATTRQAPQGTATPREELLLALRNQVRTPITALLIGGACTTLILGQPLNTVLLAFTIATNIGAGVWQERQVGKAAEALRRMSAASAQVLRGGQVATVPASAVVLGDVLLLGPGTRVAADARLLSASALEVAEAALTGESVPVVKGPQESSAARRIVLEGSDVVSGSGRAVVVAIGRHTRLGATAAALNFERLEESPLGARLARVLRIGLPISLAGGAIATLAGITHASGPVTELLALGVTTALSAIPEGLPLLAGVGQAAVARRLAEHNVVVRRLAGIEALGRVDVACSDKTGTLTEGRLSVTLLADGNTEAVFPGSLAPSQHAVLQAAALASPHPDALHSATHPTDAAVLNAVEAAGLGEHARMPRDAEVPFDSARAFHVSVVQGRFWMKGAPERVLARCAFAREGGNDLVLDEARRQAWLARVAALGERGLRVLLVAEGPARGTPANPTGLTALGFLGIRDPLRPGVPEAVARCQSAGVRIIMLTGDHPATARAIAGEAGLLVDGGAVVTAAELTRLSNDELDRRIEHVAVIARAAPLDKLRIVESLRRCGHSVAMTGDGVNDAPSLRLADVGVAMGRGGTEVARQASDVVLADDNFASLVQALVEGRGFWRNMRTGLGLLVGGNAGELGMIVGASLLGYGSPLTAPQILMVNLITDILPSLAILLQKPPDRRLAALAREGVTALDTGLRRDVIHRGVATGVPSLAAFLLAHASGGPQYARAVGFASVITTQLAQTLDAGQVQGFLSRPVIAAVGGSLGLLATTYALPPVRSLFNLVMPGPMGWAYVGAASAGAVVLSRAINTGLPLTESMVAAVRGLLQGAGPAPAQNPSNFHNTSS